MNQKLAWSTFIGGLATFLTSLGEFFTSHDTWSSMSSPNEIGHILIMTASFVVTVFGALGANLPRSNKYTRSTDKPNTEIKEDEPNE